MTGQPDADAAHILIGEGFPLEAWRAGYTGHLHFQGDLVAPEGGAVRGHWREGAVLQDWGRGG